MPIQLGQQVELTTLPRNVLFLRAMQIVDGVSIGAKMSALVHAGKKSGSPVCCMSLRKAATERVAHDDEGGKVATR